MSGSPDISPFSWSRLVLLFTKINGMITDNGQTSIPRRNCPLSSVGGGKWKGWVFSYSLGAGGAAPPPPASHLSALPEVAEIYQVLDPYTMLRYIYIYPCLYIYIHIYNYIHEYLRLRNISRTNHPKNVHSVK